MPCLALCYAVRVLMLGIFTAHRDWVPAVSRPPGHLQAVQVRSQAALCCTVLRRCLHRACRAWRQPQQPALSRASHFADDANMCAGNVYMCRWWAG